MKHASQTYKQLSKVDKKLKHLASFKTMYIKQSQHNGIWSNLIYVILQVSNVSSFVSVSFYYQL
jgi:hypothetical protein